MAARAASWPWPSRRSRSVTRTSPPDDSRLCPRVPTCRSTRPTSSPRARRTRMPEQDRPRRSTISAWAKTSRNSGTAPRWDHRSARAHPFDSGTREDLIREPPALVFGIHEPRRAMPAANIEPVERRRLARAADAATGTLRLAAHVDAGNGYAGPLVAPVADWIAGAVRAGQHEHAPAPAGQASSSFRQQPSTPQQPPASGQ